MSQGTTSYGGIYTRSIKTKIYRTLLLPSISRFHLCGKEEWRAQTSFSAITGHYHYQVMLYRLAFAPSVFQSMVNEILRDYLHKFVIAYLDDILIYSQDIETHVKHIRQVLQQLLQNNLFVKAEKCEFHRDYLFSGLYYINTTGVSMDKRKVKAVQDWPKLQALKDLQRFLGFANFYRRFI